jgi:hypothetical protein
MPDLQPKFRLIVTEPAGWRILDRPQPIGGGANSPRSDMVGSLKYAYEIISIEGVPYACLVPKEPNKVEWGRVAEQGGVLFDDHGEYVEQVKGVRAYVKVIPLVDNESLLVVVMRELINAIINLTLEIRAKFLRQV